MDVDKIGIGHEVIPPDALEQHRAGQHRPAVADEFHQQLELELGEVDRMAGAPRAEGGGADNDIPRLQRVGAGVGPAAAAQDRGQPRVQLDCGDGLDDIIVRPRLQSLDLVLRRRQRGQHDHRQRHPARAQRLQHRHAVEPRHHPIEDDGVEGRLVDRRQRRAPVRGDRGAMADRAQFLGQRFGISGIVFDEEQAKRHGASKRWFGGPPSSDFRSVARGRTADSRRSARLRRSAAPLPPDQPAPRSAAGTIPSASRP